MTSLGLAPVSCNACCLHGRDSDLRVSVGTGDCAHEVAEGSTDRSPAASDRLELRMTEPITDSLIALWPWGRFKLNRRADYVARRVDSETDHDDPCGIG